MPNCCSILKNNGDRRVGTTPETLSLRRMIAPRGALRITRHKRRHKLVQQNGTKGIDSRADSCYRLGMSFGVNIRKAVHGFLAFGLLVALGHGPVLRHTPGDTNGDGHVNVLDVQALIATALAGGAQDPRADVNRDGVVDVRDLQALLLLSEEEGSAKTEPRDADSGVLQSAKLDMPHLRAEFRMPSLSTACQLLTENELHHVAVDQAAPLPPSKADRYALSLTPHAPPHRA